MKKITLLMVLLALTTVTLKSYAANKLEVTKIVAPTANSDITIGEFWDYTVEITNNGTVDFTTTDTAAIYIGFVSGQQLVNLTVIAAYMASATLAPGQSEEFTFKVKINFSSPGLYGIGYGLYWWKNPEPSTMSFQLSAFNYIKSASIEDDYFAVNRAWYTGDEVKLDLTSNGSHNINLSLYNMDGREVFSKQVNLSGYGIKSETIETGYLPKGIYIVAIKNDGIITTKKVMVR